MMRMRAEPLHIGPHALRIGHRFETLFPSAFHYTTLSRKAGELCAARRPLRMQRTGKCEDQHCSDRTTHVSPPVSAQRLKSLRIAPFETRFTRPFTAHTDPHTPALACAQGPPGQAKPPESPAAVAA